MVNPLKNGPTSPPAGSSASDLPAWGDDRDREARHAQPARTAFPPSAIPMLGGASLWLGVVVACTSAAWADNPPAGRSPADAAATPAPPGADSLKALNASIQRLETRLKTLKDRLAAMPRSGSSPDLDALRSRVDNLAKSTEPVVPLVKRVSALDERVGAVDKQVADLRAQVAALKAKIEKSAAADRAGATSEGDFAKAVEVFKASRYKEASALFRTLTQARPDDARVWYYAGLSNGLATNNWADETLRLVQKGVEREKAGTPDKAKIDASLAGVTVRDVKNWLDSYRKSIRR